MKMNRKDLEAFMLRKKNQSSLVPGINHQFRPGPPLTVYDVTESGNGGDGGGADGVFYPKMSNNVSAVSMTPMADRASTQAASI